MQLSIENLISSLNEISQLISNDIDTTIERSKAVNLLMFPAGDQWDVPAVEITNYIKVHHNIETSYQEVVSMIPEACERLGIQYIMGKNLANLDEEPKAYTVRF